MARAYLPCAYIPYEKSNGLAFGGFCQVVDQLGKLTATFAEQLRLTKCLDIYVTIRDTNLSLTGTSLMGAMCDLMKDMYFFTNRKPLYY